MRTLAALAIFLLSLPAQAHTTVELETWTADWLTRVETVGWDLTVELAAEYSDMVKRHPCFPIACPAAVVTTPTMGTSAPAAAANNSGMGTNVEQWRSKVASYFPADQIDLALAVMNCESGGNPWADNPRSSATGLMQILASTWGPRFGYTTAQLFDPDINLYVASLLYYDGGWRHWRASIGCWG